jgi:hypothetical protein
MMRAMRKGGENAVTEGEFAGAKKRTQTDSGSSYGKASYATRICSIVWRGLTDTGFESSDFFLATRTTKITGLAGERSDHSQVTFLYFPRSNSEYYDGGYPPLHGKLRRAMGDGEVRQFSSCRVSRLAWILPVGAARVIPLLSLHHTSKGVADVSRVVASHREFQDQEPRARFSTPPTPPGVPAFP